MNLDKLLFEKVFIIKYHSANTSGVMVVRTSHYEKKLNKFKRAFKDCNIYYMSECILTPEVIKEHNL